MNRLGPCAMRTIARLIAEVIQRAEVRCQASVGP